MIYWVGGAVVWLLLFIFLGFHSLRKGHWVMFILGFFLPLFWLIGALLPAYGSAPALTRGVTLRAVTRRGGRDRRG